MEIFQLNNSASKIGTEDRITVNDTEKTIPRRLRGFSSTLKKEVILERSTVSYHANTNSFFRKQTPSSLLTIEKALVQRKQVFMVGYTDPKSSPANNR